MSPGATLSSYTPYPAQAVDNSRGVETSAQTQKGANAGVTAAAATDATAHGLQYAADTATSGAKKAANATLSGAGAVANAAQYGAGTVAGAVTSGFTAAKDTVASGANTIRNTVAPAAPAVDATRIYAGSTAMPATNSAEKTFQEKTTFSSKTFADTRKPEILREPKTRVRHTAMPPSTSTTRTTTTTTAAPLPATRPHRTNVSVDADLTQGVLARNQSAGVGTRPITLAGYHSHNLVRVGAAVGLGLTLASLLMTTTVLVPLSWIYFAGGTACALDWLITSLLRAHAKAENPSAEPYMAIEGNAHAWEGTTNVQSAPLNSLPSGRVVESRVRRARVVDTSRDLATQVEEAVAMCNSVVAQLEDRRRNLELLAEESNRKVVEHDKVIQEVSGTSSASQTEIRNIAETHNQDVRKVNSSINQIVDELVPVLHERDSLLQLNKDRLRSIAAQDGTDAKTLEAVLISRRAEAANAARLAAGMDETQKTIDQVLAALGNIRTASTVAVRASETEKVLRIKETQLKVEAEQATEVRGTTVRVA
jgi:hypothetical protein